MGEILFLCHRIPWPADRGDKIRSHWMLRRLASIAPVHVGSFAEDARDAGFVSDLAALAKTHHIAMRTKPNWRAGVEALAKCVPVSVAAFHDAGLAEWVRATLVAHPIDSIVVFSGQMAQYIPADFKGRIIMDFVDVDSAKFESYAASGNPLMRWVNAREGRMLAVMEAKVAARADASFLVSEAEAALFRARSGASNVAALSNGIDCVFYDPEAAFECLPAANGPRLVFTGQMDYRPNVEAVESFAREVLPIIRQSHPTAEFLIVGRQPTAAVMALSSLPGVTVTGAVDDVRTYLAAADLVVAPLRIARGIQNKVLEAMAMARPVLASTAAAEGIHATDGVHFCVAANPAEEARMATELLADAPRRAMMGHSARAHVHTHYGWQAALDPLEAALSSNPHPSALEQAA
jgi:polysaccharide biosynthesis protein PslH